VFEKNVFCFISNLPISLLCTHKLLRQQKCTLIHRFKLAGSFNFMQTLDSMFAKELSKAGGLYQMFLEIFTEVHLQCLFSGF